MNWSKTPKTGFLDSRPTFTAYVTTCPFQLVSGMYRGMQQSVPDVALINHVQIQRGGQGVRTSPPPEKSQKYRFF